MIPRVLFSPQLTDEQFASLAPDVVALAHVDPWGDGTVAVSWTVEPAQWHLLPLIRAELQKFPDAPKLSRNYLKNDDDPRDAALVIPGLSDLKGAKVLSPSIERKQYCKRCAAIYNTVEPSPSITLALPPPLYVPGLFRVEDSTIAFASEPLVEQLDRQGLLGGLELVPTTLVHPTDYNYFGLLARCMLRRAEPYGSESSTRPCAQCGAQSPAYEFFHIFEHPRCREEVGLDWYSEHVMGPAYPIASGRVYRWLKGPGAAYVGQYMDGKPMWGTRCGWYPEDSKLGYLPERFQRASLEPVEPLRPDEYPLPKPTPRRRKITR